MDSLEYSFASIADIPGEVGAYAAKSNAQDNSLDTSIYGLKVSTEAMKNAALKYGIHT